MPKTADYVLIWNLKQDVYTLYERVSEQHEHGGNVPLLQVQAQIQREDKEMADWVCWLDAHTSFAFQGKQGQLTLLKEARQRGAEGYWYAYRRQGKRMHKKYAGRSAHLTPAHLEAIAEALGTVVGESVRGERQAQGPYNLAPSPLVAMRGGKVAGKASREEGISQTLVGKQEQLLEPKLRLPRLRASLVERKRLFVLLDGGRERKLTLLSAPAGSGKTTLVRQWVESRSRHGQGKFPAVAWVSLDGGDNDPARFWRYVITACRAFQDDEGQSALALLATTLQPPFRSLPLEEVLATFLNAVTRSSQEGMLVLEDYHVIKEPRIHEMMTFLLDHLPATLHLVMLARTDPALPLARLRASGELCELRAADLRFSSEEAAAFLKQSLPLEDAAFSDEVLRQLDTRLEGWAAGLRLFVLALNERVQQQEIERALSSFVGSQRTLQEYFVTEVLNTQPEQVQHFLLSTSVLSRLTGSLCNAVTGESDGEQMLALLERKGIFLEALDDGGQWYRYHALFAEAMRGEVRHRFGEDMLRTLSAKASLWYEQQNMMVEAIEATLQAKDMQRSVELIEQHLSREWNTVKVGITVYHIYELHTMYRWLEQLPDTLMQQHPALCFAYASSIMFGFIMDRPTVEAQMFERFDKALRMAEDGWSSADNRAGLGNVLAFRAIIAQQQGEIVQAITWARKALEWVSADEHLWRTICLGVVSNDEILKGQFHLARKTTLEARAISETTRNRNFIRAYTIALSYICFEQGELHLASEYYHQMLREARDVEDHDDIGHTTLGLAWLAYEWDDLLWAEQLAQEALEKGEQLANHEFWVQSSLLLARIEHARGQSAAAQQRCIALQARLSIQTVPILYWYLRSVLALQARLALSVGDHATVQRWMSERVQDEACLPLIYREMEALVEARWLIVQEKGSEALALLAPWLNDAQRNGRVRAALEMQVLMVLAYAAGKQIREARSLLLRVLSQASAEGYLRLFLDEGAALAALLQMMLPYLHEPLLLTYLPKLLRAFSQEGAQPDAKNVMAPLVETLSPQEQRVLRLLATGYSNREIAGELIVSVNTIRSQVQSIYRKLNVNNRVAASELARHLGLL